MSRTFTGHFIQASSSRELQNKITIPAPVVRDVGLSPGDFVKMEIEGNEVVSQITSAGSRPDQMAFVVVEPVYRFYCFDSMDTVGVEIIEVKSFD